MVHIKKNLVKENVVNTCNGIIFSLKKEGNSDTCYNVTAQLISHVCLFATAWTVACQPLPSMRSSSKNTRVGCHFLLQGIFPTPVSPALAGGFFSTEPPGKPILQNGFTLNTLCYVK